MEGNRSSEAAEHGAPPVSNTTPAGTTPRSPDPSMEDTGAFETGGFAASTDTVEIDNTAVGIGGRWDTFQDRLRERRKEVIGARQGTGEGGSLRKAG